MCSPETSSPLAEVRALPQHSAAAINAWRARTRRLAEIRSIIMGNVCALFCAVTRSKKPKSVSHRKEIQNLCTTPLTHGAESEAM